MSIFKQFTFILVRSPQVDETGEPSNISRSQNHVRNGRHEEDPGRSPRFITAHRDHRPFDLLRSSATEANETYAPVGEHDILMIDVSMGVPNVIRAPGHGQTTTL